MKYFKYVVIFAILLIILIIILTKCNKDNLQNNSIKNKELITEDGIVNYLYNNKNCIFNTRKISNYKDFLHNNKTINQENLYICLTGDNKNIINILPKLLKKVNKCKIITLEADIINIPIYLLEDNKIIHWFTWNKPYKHNKLSCIPIGLNYDRHYSSITNVINENLVKYNNLEKNNNKKLVAISGSIDNDTRRKLLNFIKKSNISYDIIKNIPFKDEYIIKTKHKNSNLKVGVSDEKIYKEMLNYKFIFSPRGYGEDCHRTWECLYLGIIPIIKSSLLDDIYKDLPVLIVDDFELINDNILNDYYNNLKIKKFNYEKLYLEYWTKNL